MNKYFLCLTCSVVALTSSHLAVASPLDTSHIHTQHTLGLKPISSLEASYNLAAAVFLPDAQDGFGFASNTLDNKYETSSGNCAGFALSSCPAHAKCSKCTFDTKYKITSCDTNYKQSGNACIAKTCSEINGGYKADVPTNQICNITNTSVRTCYSSCRTVNTSGHPLDTCPSGAKCTTAPDCVTSATTKGNCSPVKQKVIGCTSSTQKVNSTATACIDKDDTCPTNYFKSCETGTQGDPKYTEKGTACYQCKPKDNCSSSKFPYTLQAGSIVYGDECENKRSISHTFDHFSTFFYNSNLHMPECKGHCKMLSASLSYGKYQENVNIRYYEPTSAQLSSPETVVTTCEQFKSALNNPDIYNIRISGHITCNDSEYYSSYEKHIYGQNKSYDILEFTHGSVTLHTKALRLSNLMLKALTRKYGFLKATAPDGSNSILPIGENIDIVGNNGSLRCSVFFKGTANRLYMESSVGVGDDSGTIVISEDAIVNFYGSEKATVNFENIVIFGKLLPAFDLGISYSTPATANLFMTGNNKTYRDKTLNNGTMITHSTWPSQWLYIIGNNSSVSNLSSDGSNINVAVGDNARYHAAASAYGNPNVAMGRNANYNQIATSQNYGGEYTYITTGDKSKFY